MKALVYHGPGRKAWEDVPAPHIVDETDAIVGVELVTICGTDLHILKGDVPAVTDGRILGHEAVGTVEAVGSAVSSLRTGDKVLVSCISSCGRCPYCRDRMYGQCVAGGGWVLGHHIDGTQAEYVRVPFADTSTHLIPHGVDDEAVLMLADILPTAYEVGAVNGAVSPGDSVVIVGAGPIGLAAIATVRLFSPGLVMVADVADARLEAAERLGADFTVNVRHDELLAAVQRVTGGQGADVAIEAVGEPETFETCTQVVRPGGRVANVGVHGRPATLHLEQLWIKNVTIRTGLVDTWSTPTLLRLLRAGRLDPRPLITHRFDLNDVLGAYDVFERARETAALKVVMYNTVLRPDHPPFGAPHRP